MRGGHRHGARPWRGGVTLALVVLAAGCGAGGTGAGAPPAAPLVAILSAFPAETAPFLEHAAIDEVVLLDGRTFRIGTLAGARVVIGMTGIGLGNATRTTESVLDAFDVSGVIVSGVAGSPYRIGDVAAPAVWALRDGSRFAVDPDYLALAAAVAAGEVAYDRCTRLPLMPEREPVCLPYAPALRVGGAGESSDPYEDNPVNCQPGTHDVFGCDVEVGSAMTLASEGAGAGAASAARAAGDAEPVAVDMETAAIARVAAARGVPFIAFRAVSDGAEDPLDLPGFPAQFFAYYRLAARNAAAATIAFLERAAGNED